jgi:hypothetical protein
MINPIDGPGPVRGPASVRRTTKTGKAKGTGFSKHLGGADEAEGASAASAAEAIGFVSGVLEVQEMDDALARAAKGKLRAKDLLDRLEDLRIGILSGSLSKGKLQQLAHIVNVRRPEVTDPRLCEILDEIDLRAQVELAKFGS